MSIMNWYTCWLRGIAHKCGGGFHRHHLINRSKVPKKLRTKAMRASLTQLLVPVCGKANVSRISDSKWAQKILLEKLTEEYGEEWCRWAVDECIVDKFKVRPHELTYDSIISGPEPPKTP